MMARSGFGTTWNNSTFTAFVPHVFWCVNLIHVVLCFQGWLSPNYFLCGKAAQVSVHQNACWLDIAGYPCSQLNAGYPRCRNTTYGCSLLSVLWKIAVALKYLIELPNRLRNTSTTETSATALNHLARVEILALLE